MGLPDLSSDPPLSHDPALRDALSSTFSYPILGLYTNNVSTPLHAHAGLRQVYKFGIGSHCAFVNKTAGRCTRNIFVYPFQPCTVITNDMLSNYSDYTHTILRNSAFADSSSLGRSFRVANCLLSLGAILSLVSLVMSVLFRPPIFGPGPPAFIPPSGPFRFIRGQTWVLLISTPAAALAPISMFTGAAIWTAIIKKAKDVNSWTVQPDRLPLGIVVSSGAGLIAAWISFCFLVVCGIAPTIESVSSFRLIHTTSKP